MTNETNTLRDAGALLRAREAVLHELETTVNDACSAVENARRPFVRVERARSAVDTARASAEADASPKTVAAWKSAKDDLELAEIETAKHVQPLRDAEAALARAARDLKAAQQGVEEATRAVTIAETVGRATIDYAELRAPLEDARAALSALNQVAASLAGAYTSANRAAADATRAGVAMSQLDALHAVAPILEDVSDAVLVAIWPGCLNTDLVGSVRHLLCSAIERDKYHEAPLALTGAIRSTLIAIVTTPAHTAAPAQVERARHELRAHLAHRAFHEAREAIAVADKERERVRLASHEAAPAAVRERIACATCGEHFKPTNARSDTCTACRAASRGGVQIDPYTGPGVARPVEDRGDRDAADPEPADARPSLAARAFGAVADLLQ